MDVATRRREARRRRLLQDPEERLKRIRDLKSESPKPSEVNSDNGQHSSITEDVTHIPHAEEVSPGLEETDRVHHSCPEPGATETPQLERTSQTPPQQTKSSGDLSSFIQNFVFSQLLLLSGQRTKSSNLTTVVCLVAVLFRASLEVEWLAPYTGKSLVVVFVVVYLPLILLVEKPKNVMSVAVLVFGVIQDFAVYLFTFIITHGLISAFT